MILFKKEFIPMILNGTKTQTRRIWEKGCRAKIGAVLECRTSYYGKPFALIKVIDIRRERLGDISDEDVIKEGFSSRDEFYAKWKEINGSLDLNIDVWVVDFLLVDRLIEEE